MTNGSERIAEYPGRPDYTALVEAARVRSPHGGFASRLADAVEALVAENATLRQAQQEQWHQNDVTLKAKNAALREQLAAAEAVIEKVRADAEDWMKAPRGEMAPCTGVGRYFIRLVAEYRSEGGDRG